MPLPSSVAPGRQNSGERTVLGHPIGLGVLFGTEMWERFSYYGMRALLVLYLVNHLLVPGRAETVVGWATMKGVLEAVLGPLSTQALASNVYGLYTGLAYLAPLVGGWLADRLVGPRRMVALGAGLMAVGHFMMAFETLLLPALLVLIVGTGAFKPNIATQVGGLYAEGDPRRDRAYSIFYVGINVGAFLAPLVCGSLGEEVGWHWGFGAAGVGMLLGLGLYLWGTRHLPPDIVRNRPAGGETTRSRLAREDRRAMLALVLLCLPVTLFWATYEQQGNTLALWIDRYTDRTVSLLGFSAEIPVTWFQAVNPLLIFVLTPLLVEFWARQSRRGREPSTLSKMALGCLGMALANLIMVAAALSGEHTSWLWLIGYFLVLTLGELYVSPIGLSLVSKVAPATHVSLMMGVWFCTSFAGNLLAGMLGGLWSRMDKPAFFLLMAGIAATAAVVIAAFRGPLHGLLDGRRAGAA